MRNARLWDCLDQWQIGMFPTDPRAHIEIAQSLNTVRRGENWELWVTIMSNENVKTILLKRFCIECLGLPFPKLFLLCVLLPLDWNHTPCMPHYETYLFTANFKYKKPQLLGWKICENSHRFSFPCNLNVHSWNELNLSSELVFEKSKASACLRL